MDKLITELHNEVHTHELDKLFTNMPQVIGMFIARKVRERLEVDKVVEHYLANKTSLERYNLSNRKLKPEIIKFVAEAVLVADAIYKAYQEDLANLNNSALEQSIKDELALDLASCLLAFTDDLINRLNTVTDGDYDKFLSGKSDLIIL